MKKLWLLMTAVLLLTSCTSDQPAAEETIPETVPEETAEETTAVMLTDGAASRFRIVRAEDADDEEVEEAIAFRKNLEEITGVKFMFGTDWEEAGETPEILIGSTNREASVTADEELTGIQYRVDADENRIVIFGETSQTIAAAAEYFPALIIKIEKMHAQNRKLYLKEKKVFGWSVQDMRYGMLKARIQTAIERIEAYVSGEINALPELAEKSLPKRGSAFRNYLDIALATRFAK